MVPDLPIYKPNLELAEQQQQPSSAPPATDMLVHLRKRIVRRPQTPPTPPPTPPPNFTPFSAGAAIAPPLQSSMKIVVDGSQSISARCEALNWIAAELNNHSVGGPSPSAQCELCDALMAALCSSPTEMEVEWSNECTNVLQWRSVTIAKLLFGGKEEAEEDDTRAGVELDGNVVDATAPMWISCIAMAYGDDAQVDDELAQLLALVVRRSSEVAMVRRCLLATALATEIDRLKALLLELLSELIVGAMCDEEVNYLMKVMTKFFLQPQGKSSVGQCSCKIVKLLHAAYLSDGNCGEKMARVLDSLEAQEQEALLRVLAD